MIFADTTLKTLRKLKVSAGSNEYLWKPSERFSDIRDGVPGTLYAVPYAVNQYMPAPLTADVGKQPIVVGAFEFFEIYDRGSMEMVLDPYTNAQALRTRVIMSLRTDCVNVQPDAFASIVL
jgi:HK97 family phage major capsid protein